jgi:purine-binding chemotaxis protein CheW
MLENENAIGAGDRRFLVFTLEGERYGIDVLRVEVVLEYTPITRVPRSAGYLRGVINHRGSVVPVVDLKLKFGFGSTREVEKHSIIVMQAELGGELISIGVLADGVEEVISLEEGELDPTPRLGGRLKAEFIRAIGKKDGSFIMILDMRAVLADLDDESGLAAGVVDAGSQAPAGPEISRSVRG